MGRSKRKGGTVKHGRFYWQLISTLLTLYWIYFLFHAVFLSSAYRNRIVLV